MHDGLFATEALRVLILMYLFVRIVLKRALKKLDAIIEFIKKKHSLK